MKQFDFIGRLLKVGAVACVMLAAMAARVSGQTTTTISSGTNVYNTGASVAIPSGFFVNDGTYYDTTSPGIMYMDGGVDVSGSGTTTLWDFRYRSGGTSVLNSLVSVYNTATIDAGTTVDAGSGNLYIRTDLPVHYSTANLVVEGVLTGTVNGLVAYSTATNGCGASYTPTLSTNVSGSVVLYQWESSPDNSTWTPVSGATSATYAPTVSANVYYHAVVTTTNSSFNNTTSSILLNAPSPTPSAVSGTLTVCTGLTTSLSSSPSGGTWSSNNANVSLTGTTSTTVTVTGVSAGTSVVSYATSPACYVTATVTVNTTPTISGNLTLSTAITTTLAATPSGGTWLSVSTGVATIGASSGVVSGVGAGTSVISYTSLGGCVATTTVTVLTPENALNFDGTDDYVSLPGGLTSTYNDFTFEAWVYPTSNATWQRIMDFGNSSTTYMFLTTSYDGAGTPRFAITSTGVGGEQQITSSVPMPLSQWSHIALTINGSTNVGTLYINGNVVATSSSITLHPSSLGALANNWLGRSQFGVDPYLNGNEDEVRIWNTVRSQGQIQADMNCDVPQNTNLKAYYRFNQGTAGGTNTGLSCAIDYSGNANSGALNNFTLSGATSNWVAGAIGTCNTISVPGPGTFSGNTPVCLGSTITLSNTVTGGVWSTASGNVTVGSLTGVVTGVTPGTTAAVDYTYNCSTSSVTATVNPVPAITSVTPAIATPSTAVTIVGTGLNATTTNNIVYFGATQATVNTATTTSLNVTVPVDAILSPVTVKTSDCNLQAYSLSYFLPTKGTTSVLAMNSPVSFTTGSHPNHVSVGDIDGDGKSDVIVINAGSANFGVYLNTSTSGSITSGSLAAAVNISTSSSPFACAVGDIDGDGKLDVVVTRNSSLVSVYRNTSTVGSVSFAAAVDLTAGGNTYWVAIGDLDQDGKPDLAVANNSSSSISLFKNTSTPGSVSFATKVDFTAPGAPWGIAIGDIDGDGKPDVVSAHDGSPATVSVFMNTSTFNVINSSTLAAKVDFTSAGNQGVSIGLADIDGDGKLDIVTPSYGANLVGVLRNTATPGTINSGSLAGVVTFAVTGNPIDMGIGDLNGDSKPDIVTFNFGTAGSNSTSVLINQSVSGTVSMASVVNFAASGANPWGGAVGDIDGDDRPDVLVGNSSGGANGLVIIRNNSANTPPVFAGGSPQNLVMCENSSAVSINSLMAVTDVDLGQTLTWSVSSAPAHGTLAGVASYTAATTGGTVTPTGMTYTPTSGYSGTDVFTIQVSDGFNTATTTINVTVNPLGSPSFTVAPTTNSCIGVSNTYTTQSGQSGYTWSLTGTLGTDYSIVSGGTGPTDATVTVAWLTTGVKTVTVDYTTPDGCSSTGPASNSITINSLPTPTFTVAPVAPICIGGSATYTTQSGKTAYSWSLPGVVSTDYTITGGGTGPGSNTVTVTWLTGGNKTVTVNYLDINGCTGASPATTTTTVNTLPPVSGGSDVGICQGSSTTLTASGATTYSWSPAASLSASTGTSVVASPTVTTTYTVTGTNGSGCTNFATVTVTVNPLPTPTFTTSPGATTCEGVSTVYTTQSGQTSYTWIVPGTLGVDYMIVAGGTGGTNNTVTLQWYTSGSKTVMVNYTDPNGCVNPTAASNTTTIQMAPTVAALSSAVGIPGNSITIGGTGFNTTPANDIVFFGSPKASVTAAGGTTLTVTIPNNAVYSPVISVMNNTCALQGFSPYPFLPTYNNAGFISNTVNFDPRVNFTVGSSANRIGYGDVDGDGKTDIIVNNSGTGTVSVYRNTSTSGSVSFASAVVVGTGFAFPGQQVMGDLDGDGKLDLVFMTANAPAAANVYRNTSTPGSISFASPLIVTYFTNANSCYLADIDGDGKLDIVGNELSTMSVFRNTTQAPGSISFAARVNFTAPATINFTSAGDVDGDGKPDILVSTSGGTSSLSIWRNTSTPGSISLASRQDFTTPAGAGNYVALADIDGDGKSDVMTINQGAGTWSLFPNTSTSGSISLGTRSDFTVGPNPGSLFIADFDGDGKPDVSATSLSSGINVVYRNTSSVGSFSFASSVPFTSGAGAASMFAGDIDGDGKADVTILNQSTTTMSVLRNDPLQAITGASAVCVSSTITLADATPSGTWSSSNTGIATVGSTTGVVSGVSGGVVTITYSGTSGVEVLGNYTTKTVTVNARPVPSFTTAPGATVCANDIITYTTQSGQTSYLWSLTGTSGVDYVIVGGGVGSSSNTVTLKWVTTGTKTVTVNYTDANGCTGASPASNTTTVNPLPSSIAGPTAVCVGATITLSSSPTGGTWSSSNTAIATVGSISGVVSGITSGSVMITYTLPTGCYVTSNIIVNSNPVVTASNNSPACVGGLVNFTSLGVGTGTIHYSWSGPAGFTSTIASPGISGVVLTNAGTYTVTATNVPTGCFSSTTTVVTVNPTPTTTPTNTSPVCVGGTVNFNAVATATGTISYSWTGPAGFTSAIATPSRSGITTAHAGTYVITVSTSGSGCTATAVTVVTVNPTPTAAPTNSSPVCLGNIVTLTANPTSGTGVTGYSWSGPGGFTSTAANPTVTPTITSTYSLTVTSGISSGCSPSTVYTTVVTVNPLPAPIGGGIPVTSTLSYTGGVQTFTVPAGVTSLSVDMKGATGGAYGCAGVTPGYGGRVQCTLAVTPGQVLNVYVGGVGTSGICTTPTPSAGGFNGGGTSGTGYSYGGGGGGATDIRIGGTALSDRKVVAGGGGGASYYFYPNSGGNGGGLTGQSGVFTYGGGTGGGGGTQVGGGAGGTAFSLTGFPGVLGIGGDGAAGTWGAGGGGGYYGGGGGAYSSGGGGSSYTDPTLVSGAIHTQGYNSSGDGLVTITYTIPAAICVGTTTTLTTTSSGGVWSSSSTSQATVGSSSGIVTGIAAGTPVISYTFATGCYATTTITVNPLPSAITGTASACVGSSTTLADATTGGTWSSSAPGTASVGSSTGVVTGIASGTATITYTLPTGCFATTTYTVNAAPTAITGVFSVCTGSTTALSSSPGGGTWTSSNTAIATVSGTGVVSGVSAGSVVITYSAGAGCFVTATVTVNPLPGAISGSLVICNGTTSALSSSSTGGTWTSGTPAVASIGASSGVVTGNTPGTTLITYTLSTGCITTATVTVNAVPTAITGTFVYCAGATGALSSTPTGGIWSSSNPALATVGSTSGSVTAVSAGIPVITYTLGSGCFTTTPITVNANPAAITGTMVLCVGNSTTLADATSGGTWSSSSPSVASIGSSSGYVNALTPGTTTITYTLASGCSVSATLTINAIPTPISGTTVYCVGATGSLSSSPSGGTWSSSNPAMATIGAVSGVVTALAAGSPTITYSLSTACYVTQAITVNPLPAAIGGTLSVCTGATTTLTDASTGGTWTSSNTAVATIGSATGIVSGLSAGTTTIDYTLSTGCVVSATVTVNPTPTAITGTATVCIGLTTTLASTPSGGTWTSSNTSMATVVSTTGVVTGVAAGSPVITYMMPTGCYTTTYVTVNTLPAAIGGTLAVCSGGITTLTDASSGGTWSSSNTTVASVGSSTGIVTGNAPGTATITYTLSTGCVTTAVVTVNPLPAPIAVGIPVTSTLSYTGGVQTFTVPAGVTSVNVDMTGATGGAYGCAGVTPGYGGRVQCTLAVTPGQVLNVYVGGVGTSGICTTPTPSAGGFNGGGTSGTGYSYGGGGGGASDIRIGGTALSDRKVVAGGGGGACYYWYPNSGGNGGGLTGQSGVFTYGGGTGGGGGTQVGGGAGGTAFSLSGFPGVLGIGGDGAAGTWGAGGGGGYYGGGGAAYGSGGGGSSYTDPALVSGVTNIQGYNASGNGLVTISYTLPPSVCVGSTTTLSTTPSGGTWSSSNTTVATVSASTGVVTGIAAGSATITYTLATGCYVTTAITVNPLPAAITGTPNVCTGASVGLADASTGGTWSSSNTALATVGSTTGVVSGLTNGTLTITYSLPTGCIATTPFTVNPTPTPISGTLSVCVGLTTALSSTPGGGTWSSSNTAQATVSGSGVVTGVSSGMPVISYVLSTGCMTMATVTVNPLPAAIAGLSTVCVGSSITVSSTTTGGTWSSSNTALATVGSTTGIVTGIASGTPTIVYTLPTGCTTSRVITVNPVPTAITGTLMVCEGATTSLASTPAGGTWTSSNPSEATVTGAGVVAGVSAGIPAITYTLATGCFITANVTVNPTPPASTGPSQVCVGATITLANSLTGGTWSSSNTGLATVGSTTGVVTGLAGGTLNIVYTMPTSCSSSKAITVNAMPAAITGPTQVCPATTITLADATPGGTWSSSNTIIATVGSSTGVVTGVAAGAVTISYTMATGCTVTYNVTVNAAPNISSFSPPSAGSPCIGGSSLVTVTSLSLGAGTFTVTYDLTGANVSSGNIATLTMGSSTGTFTIPSSLLLSSGGTTVTITGITNTLGCTTTLSTSNTSSFTVIALPTVFTVTGGGSYCAGGTGVHIGLSGSQVGVNYQLFLGATAIGGPVAGTTGALDFGLITTAGTYTVVATTTTGGCVSNMSGSATVVVNPLPAVFAITGGGSYCAGGTGVAVGLSGSQTGVNYQLYVGSVTVGAPVAGTGGVISFGLNTIAGTYTVVATTTAGCVGTMSGSVTITINPLPTTPTGTLTVCVGSTTTLGSTPSGGTWSSSNIALASVGSATGAVLGVNAGTPVISYTLPTGCYIIAVVTVNPLPGAITGTPNVCVGLTTSLSSGTGGGTWSSSNIALATVGSTSGVVTGVLSGVPTISYVLSTGCMVTAPITVNSNPAAITGTSTICVGGTSALSDATGGGTWSSSATGIATISSTGVVTGMSAGTATITYTLSTGCIATYAITVNSAPAAITGTANVCVGSVTSLSDGTSGGTWSSSNTAIATVGSSTGVVSGVGAGTVVISYTLPSGCFTTVSVTVNPAPAAITGVATVCIGATTALSDATPGGTWSSSSTGIAGVGATTGIVSGVSVGMPVITYTLPAGCYATFPVTVNPNPSAITGVATVCVTASTTLADATPGGTWSSSNPSVAGVSAGTGVVTGFIAGSAIITYSLPSGCYATRVVTVNPVPVPITGIPNVCTGASVTLADATTGGTWSSSNTSLALAASTTGVITGVAVGTPVITYALSTGCIATMQITVNQSPSAISGPSFVCVGSTITLGNTFGGGVWTSSNSSLATVGSLTGVVAGVALGTPTITYTLSPGGCMATAVITVNPTPAAITGTMVVCAGSNTMLSDATSGGTWSSSNTLVATVGATTGVVSGVSAGTATISYTLPGGCAALATVTVNPLPAAIGGANNVCVGSATTLTNTSGGGMWTSSNTSRALIGSASGIVSGISAGPLTITYTLPTGCYITLPFTVNPLPAAITGTAVVCVASTTTLFDVAPGGSWSSSNTAIAAVTTTSGIVSGVSGGFATITYTLPTGCFVTRTVTVNPLPTIFSVTGGGGFCVGGTGVHVGLNNSNVGINYQLYVGSTAIGSPLAGTGASLDFGLMTTAGTYTVIATNATTGCTVNMSGTASVFGYPLPATFTVTGGGSYCAGGSGVTIGLSGSSIGVNYQLYSGVTPVGSLVAGTGSAISFGSITAAGTYMVVATDGTTGCTRNMIGTASVTINPTPLVFSVTGGGAYCTGGTGVHIGLSNSASGVNYQLFRGVTLVSTTAGTGTVLDFGLFTTAGTYTVVAINATTSCTANMAGSANVSISALPGLFTVAGGGSFCAGGSGVAVTLGGSATGVNYQLYVGTSAIGAAMAGTGAALNFGLQTTGGTYTVVATDAITGCTRTMTGSVVVTVNPLPTVFAVTGGGTYCSGGSGLPIGVAGSQSGVNYQLYRGTVLVSTISGTGSAINFASQTTAGTYTVVAVNPTTTCTNPMSGSTSIVIAPLPVAFTVTGGGGYCAGGAGVSVGLSGSQTGATYQLFRAGTILVSTLSGTGVALDFGLQTAAGTYTVVATIPGTGCTNNMSGSVVVTINALPTASAVTGGGAYCFGGSGVAVGLAGSQTGVSYQLYNGTSAMGTPVTGTGSAISFGLQTVTGTYTVVATNTTTGCVNTMTGSATVTTTPLPTVYSMTGGGSFCAGGTGVSIGLSGSQSGVSYQLYSGTVTVGSPVTGTGGAISFGIFTTAGTYTVLATSTTPCVSSMSGSAVVIVNPLPTAFTVTGGGTYCSGGIGVSVGLSGSATGINYQLMLGSTAVGGPVAGTGGSLDFGLMTTGGSYTVVATNTTTGCTATMTGSATVSVSALPSAFTVTGGGGYCVGGTGVSVGLSGSQTGVDYQLYNGTTAVGAPVPGTGSALSFGLQTAAGTYTVMATDGTTTCINTMSGSATVTINPLPATYVVTGGGGYCAGGTGVVVGLSGSQFGVSYQLFNGPTAYGLPLAGTGGAISFGPQSVAGTYTVVATNGTTGCTSNMSGSASVVVNPLPVILAVTGGGSYCAGGAGVHVGLVSSAIGVNYQLYRGTTSVGIPVSGTGSALDFGLQTTAGTYTVIATDPLSGCTSNMSGSAVVSINALPTAYTVVGGGSYCAGGSGVAVALSGSATGVSYQLYRSSVAVGSPVAGTGTSINFGLQTIAGTYTVVATVTFSGCINNMTGSATVTVNSLPTAYTVTGGGSYCAGSTGLHIGLSGSAAGVNYQLFRGTSVVSALVGGTGAALDFGTFTTAGTYTVVATVAATGCTDNMLGSATITVNSVPSAFSVTGGGSYCAGGSGVLVGLSGSATGVNYQLYVGTTPVGSTVAGTGSALSFGYETTAGTYTVVATDAITGCTNTMTGSATVTVGATPLVFSMTGGGSYCSGPGYHIGLSGSSTGVSYQLYRGASAYGSPLSGTGAALDFGLFGAIGTYTVIATNISSSCTATMSGVANITPGALPTAYTVTGGGSLCSGGTGFAVGLSGSQVGVNYQLYRGASIVGSPLPGTGASLNFGVMTTAGGYTVIATNGTSGCVNNMTGSATITVYSLPTAYTVTGGGSYCAGGTGVAIGLSGSNTGVVYRLYRGTTLVTTTAGTGSAISFGLQTTAGTYTVVAQNTTTTCTNNMAGSATVSISSLPLISGSIYTVAPGATITLSGSPSGGTWHSGTSSVATIGATSGVVTGVTLGTSLISYTITSTGCMSTHMVSVTPTGHRAGPDNNTVTASEGTTIYVAPNPNKGIFTIKGTYGTTDDVAVSIEVTDMLGQVIYRGNATATGGELNEVIQLKGIANGMYLLSLRSGVADKVFHIVVEQ